TPFQLKRTFHVYMTILLAMCIALTESLEQRLTYRLDIHIIDDLASSSISHIEYINGAVRLSRDFRQSDIEPALVQNMRQPVQQTKMILRLHLNDGMAIGARVFYRDLWRLCKRAQFAFV